MDKIIQELSSRNMKEESPSFCVGDIVKVEYLIKEGKNERVQPFIGQCIQFKGNGIAKTFAVRRIVQGEGVERTFPLHSPRVINVSVERGPNNKPRRAKLLFLRDRQGRSAQL
ncbi:MAG: large subunit ribosomal protein L19 [Myxococcota bacterium]|jgi:large subunit ribosomal protein L19